MDPARRSQYAPSSTSPAAPTSLSTVNAVAEAATTAARPTAAAIPHISTPTSLPRVVASASCRPPRAALRTTSTVAGPGVRVRSAATGRKLQSISLTRRRIRVTRSRQPAPRVIDHHLRQVFVGHPALLQLGNHLLEEERHRPVGYLVRLQVVLHFERKPVERRAVVLGEEHAVGMALLEKGQDGGVAAVGR